MALVANACIYAYPDRRGQFVSTATTAHDDAARVLALLAEAATEMHATLTRFDQISGDGDFGDNFRGAFGLIRQRLEERSADEPFRVAADVFLDDVGGSSGPLLGLLFQSIARAVAENDDVAAAFAAGVPTGTAAIARIGEAEVGDRTMIDALVPACEALAGGATPAGVAEAAHTAALATASMTARRGRSSYVGERALGVPDPGAIGVSLLFWALAKALEPDSVAATASDFVAMT